VEQGHDFSGGWNFGPAGESARTVGEVVTEFSQAMGKIKHQIDTDDHPHEAAWLKLDCSKANQLLRWTPRLNFKQAISMTGQWYTAWQQRLDLRKVTLDQIQCYETIKDQ
jgi:CDP-glucose 4,6-dehydratase